jgi:DNA repair exonuclease SbcCD ATPase subunit
VSNPTKNNQTSREYLLGALPEAETERLDELSVTDDEFAESLQVAETDLVDAYVLGELTGADLERFKTHYLTSPLRREKVEFAKVLQSFGEQELADPVAGTAAAPTRRGRFAAWGGFFTPPPILQWGLAAAALAMLIVGGWFAFDNLRLHRQMSQTAERRDQLLQREQDLQKELENQRALNSQTEQELARLRDERERLEQELNQAQAGAKPSPSEGVIVSLILTPPLRNSGQLPTLSLRPHSNEVAAQLQLEAADYSVYRVVLIDPANNQTLWRSGSLRPRIQGTRKAIGVSFRAGLLKAQNYVLQVSGVPAGGGAEIVGDYTFRVVK